MKKRRVIPISLLDLPDELVASIVQQLRRCCEPEFIAVIKTLHPEREPHIGPIAEHVQALEAACRMHICTLSNLALCRRLRELVHVELCRWHAEFFPKWTCRDGVSDWTSKTHMPYPVTPQQLAIPSPRPLTDDERCCQRALLISVYLAEVDHW